MRIEKQSYDYKKHIIHLLAAGAMALSWATVSHVNTFLHGQLRPAQTRSKKNTQTPKPQPRTVMTTTEFSEPPPKVFADVATRTTAQTTTKAPAAPMATVTVAKSTVVTSPTPATPVADNADNTVFASAPLVPAAKTKHRIKITAMLSSATLTPAIAAKMGISIKDSKIDTDFIRKVEGSVLKGYVPLAATTKSGVTIADGFDLGQMHLSEFNQLPITADLKAKLQPYVGLTRFQAKDFLKAHPLTISHDELEQLNVVAANKILQPLVQAYDKASGKSFFDLPAQAQTVIFSYAYQHGPGFMRSSSGRQLWNYFITQNWPKASATLRSAKMYASRRMQEAKLLDHLT